MNFGPRCPGCGERNMVRLGLGNDGKPWYDCQSGKHMSHVYRLSEIWAEIHRPRKVASAGLQPGSLPPNSRPPDAEREK
jgi:hypothetical protein